MARSRENPRQRKPLPRPARILLWGVAVSVIFAMLIVAVREEFWPMLAEAIGIGTMVGLSYAIVKLAPHTGHSLRTIGLVIVKVFVLFCVISMILDALLDENSGDAIRYNAFFVMALMGASLLYLYVVSSGIRLRLPGVSAKDTDLKAARPAWRKGHAEDASEDDIATLQVTRLRSGGMPMRIENASPLPVLRAETTLELIREADAPDESEKPVTQVMGKSFSIRAGSSYPTDLGSTFTHVGIFRVRTAGICVHDLLGLLSRTRGQSSQWRVRVVPNIYRLTYGIPRDRRLRQDSLGIPDSPADALDYDRVRDYRPGDPLKTIHWKIVAHGQGDLYTKLFETPTISAITLVIDPHGPSAVSEEAAYHLYDTMLEGGLTLLEHAHENGIPGHLRFVDRRGLLVETRWDGRSMLGSLIETLRRPTGSTGTQGQSMMAVHSLQDGHAGYALFATSWLCDSTVEELIACHQAGVSLLVVHALPTSPQSEATRQRSYDTRLRDAAVHVVALEDGRQIVREVSTT